MKSTIIILAIAFLFVACDADSERKRAAYKAYEMQMDAIDKVYNR